MERGKSKGKVQGCWKKSLRFFFFFFLARFFIHSASALLVIVCSNAVGSGVITYPRQSRLSMYLPKKPSNVRSMWNSSVGHDGMEFESWLNIIGYVLRWHPNFKQIIVKQHNVRLLRSLFGLLNINWGSYGVPRRWSMSAQPIRS